jgi:hypothetical protein
MFNIIQFGNVVNIDSDSVEFDITVSLISGTSFQVANIEAIDCDWEVTSSGTTANIELISGMPISGGHHGYGLYWKMIYAPFTSKQTLNDITTLEPVLLNTTSGAGVGTNNAPRFEMTNKYIYFDLRHPSSVIRRYSITGTSAYQEYAGTYGGVLFCPYNDDIIYNYEEDATYGYIREIDFSGVSGTATTKYTFELSDTYNGNTYNYPYSVYFQHLKYELYDAIIHISYWNVSDYVTSPTWIIRCIIYHPDTNITTSNWIEFTDGTWPAGFEPDCSLCYMNNISPSFYNSKMIFTFRIDDYESGHPATPPYPNVCKIPTFVVDISDDTITRVDNLKQQSWQGGWNGASVVNYVNGTYYFISYFESSVSAEDDEYIFSVNINSETMAMGDVCTPHYEPFQARFIGFGVEDASAGTEADVMGIPIQTVYNTIDLLYTSKEAECIIDIPKKILWNVIESGLQGKALPGGTSRDITINWGGAMPFEYPSQKEIWFRILNGNAVMVLYSRQTGSPYYSSYKIYLLTGT